MIDETYLRYSFPDFPWDEPVPVKVLGRSKKWVCRYCIAMHGLRGAEIETIPYAFDDREFAVAHIVREHHE